MRHLIYLLVILLTLTACNNGLEEEETAVITDSINESEWIKYESKQYDFSFTYPADWILEEDGDTVQIHSLEKDLYLYSEYLDIEVVSLSFDDLKSEIENSDQLEDGTSLAQFNEPTEVDINGVKSLTGERTTAIGMPTAFYYIPLGEDGLWITRYNEFGEVEKRIISTFALENDNEEIPADSTVEPPLNEVTEDTKEITDEEIPLLSCTRFGYSGDEVQEWKETIKELYPSYTIEEVGGKCDMSNGDILLSFSYFGEAGGVQQVILLDQEMNVLKETTPVLIRKTAGGVTAPYLESKGEAIDLVFKDGDGPCSAEIRYELDLETFEYFHSSTVGECND